MKNKGKTYHWCTKCNPSSWRLSKTHENHGKYDKKRGGKSANMAAAPPPDDEDSDDDPFIGMGSLCWELGPG